MRISSDMVQFLLEQEGYQTESNGLHADEVLRAQLLRKGQSSENTLYIADGTMSRRMSATRAACIRSSANDCDHVELLEQASAIIAMLERWDGRLKDALVADTPVSDLLHIGEQVIPLPFAFYDQNAMPLGVSSTLGAWARTQEHVQSEADIDSGAIPPESMADLLEDDEYHAVSERHEPFYFDSGSSVDKRRSYCLNMHDGDTYVARMVVMVPHGQQKLHSGCEQLIQHFFGYLCALHKRYTGSQSPAANQNDSLHELLRDMLFAEHSPTPETFEKTLAAYGWSRYESYCVVKLVFFEAVSWETAAVFICRQLERHWPRSCAVYSGRCIAWVVAGVPNDEERPPFMDYVVELSRTYACKAGIGGILDDALLMTSGYREAETALAIGQLRDPHYWYYLFGDYTLDYLLQKCVEDFAPERVASKKLLALRALDSTQGSEYVATLRCYLEHKQNATHTAEALFMHRTSLLRRLDRMKDLTGIDLDDPDEVLHIQLSLKLLGY